MRYKDGRSELRTGDIVLFSGKDFISWVTKKFTKSEWSHVGFIGRIGERVMLFESLESLSTSGVRCLPLSRKVREYNGKIVVGRHISFGERMNELFVDNALNILGSPYDKREIWRILMRSMGFERDRVNRRYICSEYVWDCFSHMGIEIPCRTGVPYPKHFGECRGIESVMELTP